MLNQVEYDFIFIDFDAEFLLQPGTDISVVAAAALKSIGFFNEDYAGAFFSGG